MKWRFWKKDKVEKKVVKKKPKKSKPRKKFKWMVYIYLKEKCGPQGNILTLDCNSELEAKKNVKSFTNGRWVWNTHPNGAIRLKDVASIFYRKEEKKE